MDGDRLTHLDERGRARMVDVGEKPMTRRRAKATGAIRMDTATLNAIQVGGVPKGDVLAVARLAAIGGAKHTADTIPLCHPLPLDSVVVELELDADLPGVRISVEASVEARTGVEMEALCGVSAGLLAVYDMCKGLDRGMEISEIWLVRKQGGRSGVWQRPDDTPGERSDVGR
jgi:cyclic pyranopterin phosphate synthase